ncbi:MAG: cupin domain-containing protein [Chloroflexia bacterium]
MVSNKAGVSVTPWPDSGPPGEDAIQRKLSAEGLRAYGWSNSSGDMYAAHAHSYNKVIYVVRGTITFGLPDLNERVELVAGDRLYLPAGTRHDAVVGNEGVYCLEAHC